MERTLAEVLYWMSANLPVWRDFAILLLAGIVLLCLYAIAAGWEITK